MVSDLDLSVIGEDDELLDRIGPKGRRGGSHDRVANLLADWREELGTELDGRDDVLAAPLEQWAASHALPSPRGRRWLRRGRVSVAAAGAMLVTGTALLGIGNASPDSPMWPATRVLFPGQADARDAVVVVARAREAAREHRYEQAWTLTYEAETIASRVDDPATSRRLAESIREVRRLPGMTGVVPTPTPTPPTPQVQVKPPRLPASSPPERNEDEGESEDEVLIPSLPRLLGPSPAAGQMSPSPSPSPSAPSGLRGEVFSGLPLLGDILP